jgi:hypothetical protein
LHQFPAVDRADTICKATTRSRRCSLS